MPESGRRANAILPLVAQDLGYDVAGRRILDRVSFEIGPGPCTVILGPNGGKMTTALDSSRSAQDSTKAIRSDFALVNVRATLGAAVYDALNDASHQILLTVDSVTHSFKAHKITSAESVTIKGQIADLAPAGSALGAGFDSATGDHAARGNLSRKNPDNLNGSAALVATEFIIAVLEKSNALATGVIDAVALERERDLYSVFSGLTG